MKTDRDRKCTEKLKRGSFHADTSSDSEPMISNDPLHSMARWLTAPHALPRHIQQSLFSLYIRKHTHTHTHTHTQTHTLRGTALWERS